MLRLPISQARPGMKLALAVTHPTNPSVTLLREGAALTQGAIPRLSEMGVRELWIHFPSLAHLVEHVNPQVIEAARQVTAKIGEAIDAVTATAGASLDFVSYKRAVLAMIEKLVENPRAGTFITEMVGADKPMMRHAGNVCVHSILMGLKLDFYLIRERSRLNASIAKDISGLGVGAMLLDVGMFKLEPAALERYNATRDESDPAWRGHAQLGFDMLKSDLDPAAAAVVLHHHQHFDGSGFPSRTDLSGKELCLAGSDIHIFARIAMAADLFDRLRHPAHAPGARESAAPSIPAVRALKTLLSPPYRERIDPIVLRALLSVALPYPAGNIVRISDGRSAAVIEAYPEDPCRPLVEIIEDIECSSRRTVKAERIDLRERHDIQIVEFDGHVTAADNFYPTVKGEFDLTVFARETVSTQLPDATKAA